MAENTPGARYEFKQSCTIGSHHFVIAEDSMQGLTYLVAEMKEGLINPYLVNETRDTDYIKIWQEYICRQQQALDELITQRQDRQSDGIPYSADCCIPESKDMDFTNQIVVLRASSMKPELRIKEEQLLLAESGFGCKPHSNGRKVFCRDCWSGEHIQVSRSNLMGIMKPEMVPQWAKENSEIFRQQVRKSEEKARHGEVER